MQAVGFSDPMCLGTVFDEKRKPRKHALNTRRLRRLH